MSLPDDMVELIVHGPEETRRLGERMAACLRPGDTVAMFGELGSGKTVLAKGICEGLDVEDPVTSPSFTLIQEYAGRLPVYHLDFYRLDSSAEIEDLDIDRYVDGDGICLVEWAERGEAVLPVDRFSVAFERVVEDGRILPEDRVLKIGVPPGREFEPA